MSRAPGTEATAHGRLTWPKIRAIMEKLLSFGTHDYPPETQRRLRVMNAVAYLIIVATIIYSIQHITHYSEKFAPVIAINISLIFFAALVPFAHRFHEVAGGLLLVFAEYIALFAFAAYLGSPAGMQLQYFVGAAAPFVILGLKRKLLAFSIVLVGLVLHLLAWFWFPRHAAIIDVDNGTLNALYVNAAVTTTALIAAAVYYAYTLAEKAQAEVEKLLLNILPADIIERLNRQPDEPIADMYDSASVLFLDLSGFTVLAQKLGPKDTVKILNEIVTELDRQAAAAGIEKIKTIGDAYMAASGIPGADPDHLVKLANAALAFRAAIKRVSASNKVDIDARIGLASGPLMAGIIGTRKFSYDIWGDTVNLAARMETNCPPGNILVPENVERALTQHFEFEAAGAKSVKGFGEMNTWYLVGHGK